MCGKRWCIFIVGLVFLLALANRSEWLKKVYVGQRSTTLRVPKELELEKALASLFSRELGYTLIGEKPVSIEDNDYYLYKHPHVAKKVLLFLQKTFKDSPRFIFKTTIDEYGDYEIEFANKRALKRIIAEYPRIVALVKNRFGSIDAFLKQASSSRQGVFDLLHAHNYERGILLGYGKTNTKYFDRRCELGCYLKKYPLSSCVLTSAYYPRPKFICYPCLKPFFGLERPFHSCPKPKEREGFGSLEDEWNWLQEIEWDLSDECRPIPPYYIKLPYYICCHFGDSEQVRAKYKKASGRLASLFCNRSFTEVIIEEAAKS